MLVCLFLLSTEEVNALWAPRFQILSRSFGCMATCDIVILDLTAGLKSKALPIAVLYVANSEKRVVALHLFTRVSSKQVHRFVEFFAGDANLSWSLKCRGFTGLSFDVEFGGRYNNFFEPAGFARPGLFNLWKELQMYIRMMYPSTLYLFHK